MRRDQSTDVFLSTVSLIKSCVILGGQGCVRNRHRRFEKFLLAFQIVLVYPVE